MAGANVVEDRADDALDVESGVAVETLVLDPDRGLDHDRRDVLELHGQPVVAVIADVGENGTAAIGDQRVAGEA